MIARLWNALRRWWARPENAPLDLHELELEHIGRVTGLTDEARRWAEERAE